MSYQIIWEQGGVVSRFQGQLSPEIHREALNLLFGDSRMDDIDFIIGDFSRVSYSLLSESDIEYPLAITSGAATYLKDLKIAFVAFNQEISILCRRFIELAVLMNISWDIQLFDDMDSAREWLASYQQYKSIEAIA